MGMRHSWRRNGAPPGTRSARWRVWHGLNTTAALGLALLLAVLVNVLASLHYVRRDVSRDRFYGLSDQTLHLLSALTNDVRVVCFFQRGHPARDSLRELLREYEEASSSLDVEWVDPDRDPARTKELAAQYGVSEANVIVLEAKGRTREISASALFDFDYEPLREGKRPRKTMFLGEAVLTSALDAVAGGPGPVVYFLQGHGERSPDSYDPRTGYSSLARAMRRENIDVRILRFGERDRVPEDCDALVVAGPVRRLAPSEIERIASYLAGNGRALFLLDAHTSSGLEGLAAQWGIRVGDDVVMDDARTLTGRELFITDYSDHSITRRLQGTASVFYLPRSVEPLPPSIDPADTEDKPRAFALAWTSARGWMSTARDGSQPQFDPAKTRMRPVAVVSAAERGAIPGTGLRIHPARIVVFGDAQFVANGSLAGAGIDFFMSAMNWLLERDQWMGIAPKPVGQLHLTLNRRDQMFLFAGAVLAWPALAALTGLLVWMRRRR